MKEALLLFVFIFCSCDIFQPAYDKVTEKNLPGDQPHIDIVFCVDFSGSTNALVHSFRTQIWDILLVLNRYEPKPLVRFALIGTGRIEYKKETNYIKVLSPFTSDLDRFAAEFYKMEATVTLGKPNNVQHALADVLSKLSWSKDPLALKLAYVIGNGRIGGGEYNAFNVAEQAKDEGIIVNSVFCVNEKNMAELPQWKLLSDKGSGHFATFNPLTRIVLYNPSTRELNEMSRLNNALNSTYVDYSGSEEPGKKRLIMLDSLSGAIHPYVLQSRLILKCSEIYQRKSQEWDLVDFYMNHQEHPLGPINYINRSIKKTMPDKLRNMGKSQMQELLEKKERERLETVALMQKKIHALEMYTEKERKKLKLTEGNSIKDIIIASLDKHMESNAFEKVK
jgi:hypothetical protein